MRNEDDLFQAAGCRIGCLRHEYEDYEIQLEPGDVIFEYTDGVKEATNTEEDAEGAAKGTEKERETMSIELKARRDALPEANAFLEKVLEGKACSSKTRIQLEMSLEEIFVNIAMYAYDTDEGMVRIETGYSPDENELTITFTDHGAPYDPLAKEDPDTTLAPKERKKGGLGIYLTKNAMDDMKYEYTDGSNVLTLIKSLAPGSLQ